MRALSTLTTASFALLLAACATPGHDHDHGTAPGGGMMMGGGMMGGGMMNGPTARASLAAASGSSVGGMVMFHQQGDKVFMHARVRGLTPNQEHGFHIHEKGDCSSGDGMSTGGHFNPAGAPHGPQHQAHHAGDLPALKANAQGEADLHVELSGVSVGSGAADIVGRGLIVHAKPDDYTTQPTGNSGARIACAVIERMR